MSIPDLIARLEARPFRPFVIASRSGRRVPVLTPHQVAISPDFQAVVVAVGAAGTEVFVPAEIQSIDEPPDDAIRRAAASIPIYTDARAPSRADQGPFTVPLTSPGPRAVFAPLPPGHLERRAGHARVRLFAHEPASAFNDRVVTAVFEAAGGPPLLDLSATSFDVHALESGDNYLTIHLTHPGEPGVVMRLIFWPGVSPAQEPTATLQTFAEAMTLDQIAGALKGIDEQLTRRPRPPQPPASYWRSIKDDDAPRAHDDFVPADHPLAQSPDRFEVETRRVEGPGGDIVAESRLIDHALGAVVLDFFDLGLESRIRATQRAFGEFAFSLAIHPHRPPGPEVTFDAGTRLAYVHHAGEREPPESPEAPRIMSLRLARRLVLNAALYEPVEALLQALARGGHPPSEPEARIVRADDAIVEMWPGPASRGLPMLVPRVLGSHDRVLLDLRGTEWGAAVLPQDPHHTHHQRPRPDPHTLTLRLIQSWRLRVGDDLPDFLALNTRTRRVTSPTIPGVTTLGLLQHLLREHASPSVLRENLADLMESGAALPSIE